MSLSDLRPLIARERVPNYYPLLLKNYKSIIEAVEETNQKQVALDIGMSAPKFSVIYKLLLAYAEEKEL